MSRLKVLIVDDHTLFRDGLRFILGKCQDIRVVGESGDGIEALQKVRRLRPDIVLLDITMPELSGIDTLKAIKQIAPETNVIILTMHSKEHYVKEVLTHGANGYVLKDSASEDLISAIHAAAKGEAYLSPAISRRLITQYRKQMAKTAKSEPKKGWLTRREEEVLRMLYRGLTRKEIAAALGIGHRTVENHISNIMKKLDVHSQVGLVNYAIQGGFANATNTRSD